jgi:hypothetical protein
MDGKWKGKGREREGKGKGKGKGREREGKGKGKGRERGRYGKVKVKRRERKRKGKEREGKGKVKEITSISAVSVRFETVSEYRNKPKQTERGDYILSEKIPKQNRNCQCFGLFRLEPKEKKPFRRTP